MNQKQKYSNNSKQSLERFIRQIFIETKREFQSRRTCKKSYFITAIVIKTKKHTRIVPNTC